MTVRDDRRQVASTTFKPTVVTEFITLDGVIEEQR